MQNNVITLVVDLDLNLNLSDSFIQFYIKAHISSMFKNSISHNFKRISGLILAVWMI